MDHKSDSINCFGSCRDPESGLYTKGHFLSVLSQELARLDRGDRPLSLVILESAQLNEDDWSLFGSHVLASLRSIDLAARLEPERVVVLLPDALQSWARRWIAMLLTDITRHPVLKRFNFTWGLALARPWAGHSFSELLAMAATHLEQNNELIPGGDPHSTTEDLDTSIATDERDLLFAGFQALTEAKPKPKH